MTRYRTIVADPPWDVERGPEWGSNGPSRPLTYPTMAVEEIAALPVRDLADKWSRGEHSRKPDAFLDMVEHVSPAPRLEMFARRQRLGWDTWGDEALEHVELSA